MENEFKENLKEEYKKEESKRQISEIIDNNPELIKTIEPERLKELNYIYEEKIAQNQNKLANLRKNKKIKDDNTIPILKQELHEKYNATYIIRFYYNGKTYIQAFKNDNFETVYFIADNNEVNPVIDDKQILIFKELYEIKPSEVVDLRFNKKDINLYDELSSINPVKRFDYMWDLFKEHKTSLLVNFFVRSDITNENKLFVSKYLMPYTYMVLPEIIKRYKKQANDAKLPKSNWFEREEDAEFIKSVICDLIASDEEKIAFLRDAIPLKYTDLWEEVICSLESEEYKKRFLTIFKNKGKGDILEEELRPNEYKKYIISFVSETLENYDPFTKVFGKEFARNRMNELNGVELIDEEDKYRRGECSTEFGVIRLFDVQGNNVEEYIERSKSKSVILHESIHHILTRGVANTGIQGDFYGEFVGTGLNEGYTEWICEKSGIGSSSKGSCYGTLERFIEQIELAVGEENTMKLGTGSLVGFAEIAGISTNNLFELLKKADAVYKIGYENAKDRAMDKKAYNEAICEFESLLLELFFAKDLEELKNLPISETDLSKFEKLANLMESPMYESEIYTAVKFLKEFDKRMNKPLLIYLQKENPNIVLDNYFVDKLNGYLMKDTNPIENMEIIISSADEGRLQNVVLLINEKDAISGKYSVQRGTDGQYKFINHTGFYVDPQIIQEFERIRTETLERNPDAQIIISDYSIIIRENDEEKTYLIDEKNNSLVLADKIETVNVNIPEILSTESEERKAYVLRKKLREQEQEIALLESTPDLTQKKTEELDLSEQE